MIHVNQSGRSMVEMLGVLAIIGVLSVGGIAGYSKAMNKYKINKTTDQVSMLVANIRTLFSSQGNYGGLNNGSAIKFGVVPNDMYTVAKGENADYTANYPIKNAFNGKVNILADNARKGITATTDAFIVEYDGISDEACVTIATGDWGSGQASGLIAIAAGDGDIATDGTAGTMAGHVKKIFVDDDAEATTAAGSVIAAPGSSVATPISVTNAVKACTGGGSGNSVAWKYY